MGRWHADAVRRAGGEVIAVADADIARARKLADGFAGSRVVSSPREAMSSVEVVHVCTPLAGRDEIISAALELGCHVLAEKPLAATAGSVTELHSRAAAAGVLLCPVHQFIFQPGALRAAALCGRIAPLRQFAAVVCSAGADNRSDQERDELAFGILPHPLSLAERLTPGGLSGIRWLGNRAAAGEVQVIGSARGIAFSIQLSTTARPTRHALRIAGEGGTIHADLFHGFAFAEAGDVSRLRKTTRPFTYAAATFSAATGNLARRAMRGESGFPGLRELVARFHAAASNGGASPIPMSESLSVAVARDDIIEILRRDGALA